MGSRPALAGREAERDKSPIGDSGQVGEQRVPRIPQEPPPPPVPPSPLQASAAGTGPPSGSLKAPSPAQHDGLGAAAAGTAVPAGGARTGAGAQGSRGPGGTAASASFPVCGRSSDCSCRAHTGAAALELGPGEGSGDPKGCEGYGSAGNGVTDNAPAAPEGGRVGVGGLRQRAWGRRAFLTASPVAGAEMLEPRPAPSPSLSGREATG